MMSIADDHCGAPPNGETRHFNEPLLIGPGKVAFVIPDETVIVMRHGISGIAVDDIACLDLRNTASKSICLILALLIAPAAFSRISDS